MKRNRWFAALVCMLAVISVGCGQAGVQGAVESTTISVDKNGGLTYYLVENFDKDYYRLSELSAMAMDEADEFNGSAGEKGSVAVDKVETLQEDSSLDSRETRVLIVYRFDGYASFNEFKEKTVRMEGSFFYGTVNEAFNRGYVTKALLKSVKDETMKTEEQLKQEGTKKLIITDEKAVIYCPARVTYLSDGAVLNEDGSVDTSAADGTVYILLK